MPGVPTPIRVALGIAATAAEEARKLPETLPSAVSGVPMIAVSTAMQASLKMQQRLAALAAKGDQVLALLRPPSDEPPAWATFDESPEQAVSGAPAPQRAAFDRVDYEHPSPAEAADEHDAPDQHTSPATKSASAPKPPVPKPPAQKSPAQKSPAQKSAPKPPAKKSAPRKSAPRKAAERPAE